MALCRSHGTLLDLARNHGSNHPLSMEPKYRTLIQAAVIAVLLGTVLHFHQPAPESEGATAQLSER